MHINPFIQKTHRVFPMQGRAGYMRYDMNENPEGLPMGFVEAVKKEITPEFLATYPEPDRFLQKYAAYLGVDFDQVVATNGSDMAIRYLLEAFGERGKDVVTVAPSFEMYWVNCSILGYHHVPVAYNEDLTMDVAAIEHAITADTRVVVLLNPNNPMGNVYTKGEVERVIRRAEKVGALVIIDEAYHYFYDGTFLDFVRRYENVAVLRTFSKLFSIAACRLGVIIGSPEIIHVVKNAKLTFDVNSIALLFGERLLDHPEIEQRLIEEENIGKQHTLSSLRNHHYPCRDCRGNFIFVEPHNDAYLVEKRLREEKHVLVKTFGHPLLSRYLRVSVGSIAAMNRFLQAFYEVDQY